MKKLFVFGLIFLLAVMAAGCSGDDDDSSDDSGPTADDTADDTGADDTTDDADDSGDDVADDTNDDTSDDTETDDDDTAILDCDAALSRQPYLQLISTTGVTVMWKSDNKGDSLVEWGPTNDLGFHKRKRELKKQHELSISGLQPGTEYFYKVRTCSDESTVASFRTAPEAGVPFNFVAFSDNHCYNDIFPQIVALMQERDPWLAISSGDTVNDGWVEAEWNDGLFGPGEDLWRRTPLYVGIGNHESLSPWFFEAFHFPNNDKEYYSFTFGNVFFVGLAMDTTHISLPGTPQYNFFKRALESEEAQNADFRIVFFHTPPWTEGWEGYEGDWIVRYFYVPLMEDYGVDAYFNGHTHDYERGLRNGVASYIIGGAGGGLDYWVRDLSHITVYEAVHHFVNISVDGPTMTLDAVDVDGNVFDTYEITH